jgi:hypothetical protein
MPTEIHGLPAHVLLVHAVVVLIPLSALLVVLSAVWPAARRRIGVVSPLVALVTLALVPVTTHAGEWLARRVPRSPLLEKHTALGDTLLPWAAGMFVLAAAVWWLGRRQTLVDDSLPGGSDRPAASSGPRTPPFVRVAAAVLAIAVSAGAVVQVYRIGDSGASAAWHGQFSQTAKSGHGG